jgi:hypothetical protein
MDGSMQIDPVAVMDEVFGAVGYRDGGKRFIKTGPVPGEDGHKLLSKGGRLWSDHVDPFMDSLGFKTLVGRR